ncbi:hypothetical protein [Streptomyces sp. CT34]|uniref:hypothetical protein n=1 Tax=Streptomyces sp. CT34 TaxID=1553907 RepID=UPI0005BBFC0C|nr:hypothetical protein [Streptomyces sp. CT34]
MSLYEPIDLFDMTCREALDSVLTDIRAHPVDAGPDGFFTALRHVDILGYLASMFTGHAHHVLAGDIQTTTPSQEALASSQAAATIGRALAHYTQALPALAKVSDPVSHTTTVGAQLEALPHHTALRRHLDAAQRTLDEARIALADTTPRPPSRTGLSVAKPPAPPNAAHGHGL